METSNEEERAKQFLVGAMADETLLPRHKPQAEVFRFIRPDMGLRANVIKKLCLTDVVFAGGHFLKPGARDFMHSHAGSDGIFFVLKGRIAFHGDGDSLIGEIGPLEGVIVPRESKYWWQAVGDEVVEILHIEAFDKRVKNKRTLYAEGSSKDAPHQDRPDDVVE